MTAYYNEIEPYAAQWLRNLIAAGHIAPGDVDERSIEDVRPDDLRGYRQCHFFAGIGVWSYALRRAGWPDDRSIWTGSCPCQPFSAAGQGAAFDDERHLWPAFQHLIRERRPPVLAGEQVASKDADPWLDLVQTDLEALGYAFGAVAFPSAGVGAPHIRDRTYWMAHADMRQPEQLARQRARPREAQGGRALGEFTGRGDVDGLADAGSGVDRPQSKAANHREQETDRSADQLGRCGVSPSGLADDQLQQRSSRQSGSGAQSETSGRVKGAAKAAGLRSYNSMVVIDADTGAGPTNGLWRDADWLFCRDGKWRPVEPGTFPLVNGAASRVGRLRAYGNAINAEAARVFIEVMMECMP